MSASNDDIFKLLTTVAKEVNELRNDTRKEIQLLKKQNLELQQQVVDLKNKLHSVERRSKKYNLVIYGVTETQQPLYETVLEVINEIVGIKCEEKDFRDIYRIGRNKTKNTRPIVIETVTYKLKEEILKKAGTHSETLKREKIYFTLDYIPEDYEKQKFLREQLKQARTKNYKAHIKNNTLYVNGEAYSYEQLRKSDHVLDALEPTETLNSNQRNANSAPSTPSQTLYKVDTEIEDKKGKPEVTPSKASESRPLKITTRNTTRRNLSSTSENK